MKVKLIAYTPEPEKVVACAAKLCYSGADSIDSLMDGLTTEVVEPFVKDLIKVGHMSPLEHVSFTFAIEGVSRAVLAEITRHRIASFSVQSQRYCNMRNTSFTMPDTLYVDTVETYDEITELYRDLYDKSMDTYSKLIELGVKKEDARFVLPEATSTRMIVTMNARELIHFFALRCCNRAMWEIRDLADEMFVCAYAVAPLIFENAAPECVSNGKCPEGARCCGESKNMATHFWRLKEYAKRGNIHG